MFDVTPVQGGTSPSVPCARVVSLAFQGRQQGLTSAILLRKAVAIDSGSSTEDSRDGQEPGHYKSNGSVDSWPGARSRVRHHVIRRRIERFSGIRFHRSKVDRHLSIEEMLACGVIGPTMPGLIDLHFSSCTPKCLVDLSFARDLVDVPRSVGDKLRVLASCDIHRASDPALTISRMKEFISNAGTEG